MRTNDLATSAVAGILTKALPGLDHNFDQWTGACRRSGFQPLAAPGWRFYDTADCLCLAGNMIDAPTASIKIPATWARRVRSQAILA